MSNYTNNQGAPFKRRPSIIFNDFYQQVPQTIEPINGGRFPATWLWEISADRDKVYSKVNDGNYGASDQNAKLKTVEMGWAERNSLFEILRQAALDKEFTTSQLCVYDKSFNGGDRLPLRATFTVMRGKTGEIRVHYRRSTFEATFVMASKRIIVNKKSENGAWAPDPGMSSSCYTLSLLKALTNFLNENEINNFKPKEPKSGGNDTGGGNNTTSNNSTGGDSTADDFGDLDF